MPKAISSVREVRTTVAASQAATFPLSVSSNGRYLQTSAGNPFFISADGAWSMGSQLSRSQVDTYLNDRQSKNFSAIIFDFFERHWSSQTPPDKNAEGNRPFTTNDPPQTDFSSTNSSFWGLIDYMVAGCKSRGMLAICAVGYSGSSNLDSLGWGTQINGDTDAHLQAYGAFLATRYLNSTYNNLMFLIFGDFQPDTTNKAKYQQIVNGMLSVTSNVLVTAQVARDNSVYASCNGMTGFNVNATYTTSGNEASAAATEYARSPALPFWLTESGYENEAGTGIDWRRQAHHTILAGGCGHAFGSNPVWGFGEPNNSGGLGPADAVANHLNTAGATHMSFIKPFYESFAWTKLVPKTDPSFVSSGKSSGVNTVCPALANDGSFGMVWLGGSSTSATVVMTNISHGSVRARWWDPSNGAYTTDGASPLANTGSHTFTTPGNNSAGSSDWILVLD